MIVSAAVIIEMNGEQIAIPCHRHADAYLILKRLGFKPQDYKTVKQGFIKYEEDPEDRFTGTETFLDRVEACKYAYETGMIEGICLEGDELYSEMLW